MALSAAQALPLISQYESDNRNVINASGSTAGGYYQIINGTWQQFAPQAGVSLVQYPTAMTAPQDVQTAVATQIYNTQGFQPWASNTRLIAAVNAQTGTTDVSSSDSAFVTGGGTSSTAGGTAGVSGLVSGGGNTSLPPTAFASSFLPWVWNLIERGGLLLVGFMFIFIAVAALLWQSKSVQTTVHTVGDAVGGAGKAAGKAAGAAAFL